MDASQPRVDIAQIQMPKGGGALQGIGETFQASPFTGVGQFSIPIEIPAARGLKPDLTLTYSAGQSQGVFGLGFQLSVPEIARRTEKRLPNYSEDDEFVLSNAAYLVPAQRQVGGDWVADVGDRVDADTGETYQVRRYRPRTEGQFLNIEHWIAPDGASHWRVTTPSGVTSIYGRSRSAQVAHPTHPHQVFRWLLESTRDRQGNRVRYHYRAEDGAGVPTTLAEQNRGAPTQKYLHQIQYGNAPRDGDRWAFSVVFDYGDYDLEGPLAAAAAGDTRLHLRGLSTAPTHPWTVRPDAFSDYRAGFEIRTHRLCRNILVFHHFEAALGIPDCLVGALRLTYQTSPTTSLLVQAQRLGFRYQADGRYETSALPPLTFRYSGFEPGAQRFQPLTVAAGDRLPAQFDANGYQLLDLYGEGTPGILYDRQGVPLYQRSLGNGQFQRPEPVASYPAEQHAPNRQTTYRVEDGQQTWLTVETAERAGFYALQPDETWQGWQAFEGVALERRHPHVEQADVTGNGFPDLLLFEDERVKVYPDARTEGHRAALTALRPGDMPTTEAAALNEVVLLTDMSGDGLSDRVRIRNGSVTYWPNLGYGKFGAAVALDNAPVLERTLVPARLFVADLDGSGTTDLIYVRTDTIDIYRNQSGNRLADPISVPLPHRYHPGCQIQLADVLGNGTHSFVFSYGTQAIAHQFYDFSGGAKPYLLTEIDNHRGALTRIQYAPSTAFYRRDRAAGRPWVTRLPFPIQLVERVETVDRLARSKQVVRYAYHHGAFDLREREFAGFGLVERWDSEAFEQFAETDLSEAEAFELPAAELHVPPTYRKTWYHNGLAERENTLSQQFAAEYYTGDPDAFTLADSHFDPLNGETHSRREAYRALRGKILREEVYAEDNSPQAAHPYSVRTYAYQLRRIQPGDRTPRESVHYEALPRYSVYLPLLREDLRYDYERHPQDPRITHRFFLAHDAYGNRVRQAVLAYARRRPQQPDQAQTQGAYTYQTFANLDDPARDHYRLGMPTERQIFELGGLSAAPIPWQTLADQFPQPELTAVDADAARPGDGARLVGWQRYRYWNPDFSAILPVGQASDQAALARTETAVVSQATIATLFADFDPDGLRDKLLSLDADGGGFQVQRRAASDRPYYFDPGVTAYYGGTAQFFQPVRYVDQFGTETFITRDPEQLAIVRTEAQLSPSQRLTDSAQIDYRTLLPSQRTDANANTTEYRYTPLGHLRWISRYGTETDADGVRRRGDAALLADPPWDSPSFETVLADPAAHLQQATTRFLYDWRAWEREGQPAVVMTLQRDRYTSDLAGGDRSPVQVLLEYTDGFGRSIQKKRRAEAGSALRVSGDGTVTTVAADIRWIASGRTVFNNKGAVIRQYEPFYADSARYQPERVLTEYGTSTVRYYDPLGRVVRVASPKGYETRTEFAPWQIRQFDANDAILTSPYYDRQRADLERYRANPTFFAEDERAILNALDKALAHANTPSVDQLDVWGRQTVVQTQDRQDGPPLKTLTQLDILGNPIRQQSPRSAERGQFDFETDYDLQGRPLRQVGRDNGTYWSLYNAGGDVIHRWNARGFHTMTHYDALSRPIATWIKGGGVTQQIAQIEYGEVLDPNGDRNLRGQIARHFDSAGSLEYLGYSLDGSWQRCDRRFRNDYQADPDWSTTDDRSPETLTLARQFDALNRLTQTTYPDGRQVALRYSRSGRLQAIALTTEGRSQAIVTDITYNARNQRQQVVYGNGTTTTHTYDPDTFELLTLQSRRARDGRLLQDLHYTYDPVGNVTRLRDRGQQTVFTHNQAIAPQFDYTYDALYRLSAASGREHPALYTNRPVTELPDYGQLFAVDFDLNDGRALDRYTRQYHYDLAGNLTRIQHVASRTRYTRTQSIAAQSNRLQALTYDANGNPTALEHLRALSWNARNQLARADIIQREEAPNDAEYYVYDAAGQRVRKVSETLVSGRVEITETLYFGDYSIQRIRRGDRVLQERQTLSVQDDRERVAVAHTWPVKRGSLPDAQVRFQLSDRQGTVCLELDVRSRIIAYEEYYPFGGTALVVGQSQQEVERKLYRYAGRERDAVTQLYCYGSRYYAPWLGRWLSPDLAGPVDGLNLFTFVRNNPIRYHDDGGFKAVSADKNNRIVLFVFNDLVPHLNAREGETLSLNSLAKRRQPPVAETAPQRRRAQTVGATPRLETGGDRSRGTGQELAPRSPQLPGPTAIAPAPAAAQGSNAITIGTDDRDTLILVAVAIMVAMQLIQNELIARGEDPASEFTLRVLTEAEKKERQRAQKQREQRQEATEEQQAGGDRQDDNAVLGDPEVSGVDVDDDDDPVTELEAESSEASSELEDDSTEAGDETASDSAVSDSDSTADAGDLRDDNAAGAGEGGANNPRRLRRRNTI